MFCLLLTTYPTIVQLITYFGNFIFHFLSFCLRDFLYVKLPFARFALQNAYLKKSKQTEDDQNMKKDDQNTKKRCYQNKQNRKILTYKCWQKVGLHPPLLVDVFCERPCVES